MRLAELLGIEHPIIQGPFGGGLSSVALAATVSDAGGLGSFGAHHLEPDAITEVVRDLRGATGKPFAVNLWVPQATEREPVDLAPHIARVEPLYRRFGLEPPRDVVVPGFTDQADALLAAAPPVISLVMGLAPRWLLDAAHAKGIVVLGTATTVEEAIALEECGVDAVVASGSDAGGHRGAFLRPVEHSLVGTFSLVPQVVDAVRVPVVAAGGIADARGVRAARALGADGVQVGTGFLATHESGATEAHKVALGGQDARITVLTRLFSGRHARGIHNRLIAELAAEEGAVPPYPYQNGLMRPLREFAAEQPLADYMSLWAGQAAPLSSIRSAKDYFAALLEP
ncbi:DUF561 domain-containing protein [Actinosynnema sp. NPDC047251]|uniref:Propionate 3-nitronate monooxygenase n=1 Tax=Saccharothrix espanaensis (strain ATCC 51144 / DSM 44229 / JCM 9112 / NBRC 15066 / NRRL 15764) TaxID=1179773 RepID=K0K3A8_SACES|nr:DUF561 domain-containing protein [Saccharothrix espanaensis]CCH34720.1 2-nitropropane dioxygenase (NPD)-like protein [Saccharothrix espanaensis DSM 44229]